MEKLRVMLCCGAGMSSGFMAQRVRAEAKKEKIDIQIEARSESQVPQYYGKFEYLLLGPHFANQLPIFQALGEKHGFKAAAIPPKIYGALDAKGPLELIRSMAE